MSLASVVRRGQRAVELPSGTVTFLLTDVEASSAHWDTDAEATDVCLQRLDEVLHACVSANGGCLIKSRGEGDSAFAVFDRASAAVVAAVAVQTALANGDGLPVRAAVHTGEARLRDGDYYGVAPNRAARLRSLAHGHQTVVSRVSADLAEADLPSEIALVSLGSYRVKDWPRTTEIFGVRGPGLHTEFPPLRFLGESGQAVMTTVVVDAIGSTRAVRGLSDPELVEVQRLFVRTLRDTLNEHSGSFMKLVGDGCIAAFETPGAAVAFARDLARMTRGNVRFGAQTGVVDVIGDDIVGRSLYGAHHLSKRAKGGELVTTGATVELLVGHGVAFEPCGETDDGTPVFSLDLAAMD